MRVTVLVACCMVAGAVGGIAAATPATPAHAPFTYVALGDSYSSGEGVAPYFRDGFSSKTGAQGVISNRCHRSSRAYPTWVKRPGDAKPLYAAASGGGAPGLYGARNKYGSDTNSRSGGGVAWSSWACSGAKTANVLPKSLGGFPQGTTGRTHDRRTQLDSASLRGADLITITIGGNDVGFTGGLIVCAIGDCNTTAFEQERTRLIAATKPLLVKTYRAIATRAPEARILVIGYPQLLPATPREQSCSELQLFAGEQKLLRRLGARLNATIEAAVGVMRKSGATIEFVPVAGRFAGHEVCGKKGAWLNGVSLTSSFAPAAKSFHPTLQGQRGYAAAINAALEKGKPGPS